MKKSLFDNYFKDVILLGFCILGLIIVCVIVYTQTFSPKSVYKDLYKVFDEAELPVTMTVVEKDIVTSTRVCFVFDYNGKRISMLGITATKDNKYYKEMLEICEGDTVIFDGEHLTVKE